MIPEKRHDCWRDFASAEYAAVASLDARGRRCRLRILAGILCCWVAVVVYALAEIQLFRGEQWQEWAAKQHLSEFTVASERGPILDRNGNLLAVSVPAGSIYVRPRSVTNPDEVARQLAPLLEVPVSEIRGKLQQKKPFVWLSRQIPRVTAEKITDLNLKGVGSIVEPRRYYPYNEAASTVLGKVGIDGHGLSGLELVYERTLQGAGTSQRVLRDALGKTIHVSAAGVSPLEVPRGEPLRLTLDAGLQVIVDEELSRGRERANARSAVAVLIDSHTGEILALSQAPGLNLNSAVISSKQQLSNPIVEEVFEPGSILKPIVTALALDAGVVTPTTMLDCEEGRFTVGRHSIKDVHPVGIASVHDVVVRSSNIGMTKIGFLLGSERLYQGLRSFGFGSTVSLRFPGETAGIFRNVSRWAKVDVATHSFGQGIATSALQIVRAIGAIANGGSLPQVHLMADEAPAGGMARVISPQVAAQVQEMMYATIESPHGTGKLAAVPGVRVGGKTGTAEIARADGRGYQEGAYVASFVGFVDGRPVGVQRSLTLLVSIREPNTNSIYGGTLAAPVFQRIISRSLQFLQSQQALDEHSGSSLVEEFYVPQVQQVGFRPVSY